MTLIQGINQWLFKLAAKKLTLIPDPWVHLVHASIAFGVVLIASKRMPIWIPSIAMLVVAGVIEFWFDKHYEDQPFEDNLHDFEDYLIGVLIALLIWKGKL